MFILPAVYWPLYSCLCDTYFHFEIFFPRKKYICRKDQNYHATFDINKLKKYTVFSAPKNWNQSSQTIFREPRFWPSDRTVRTRSVRNMTATINWKVEAFTDCRITFWERNDGFQKMTWFAGRIYWVKFSFNIVSNPSWSSSPFSFQNGILEQRTRTRKGSIVLVICFGWHSSFWAIFSRQNFLTGNRPWKTVTGSRFKLEIPSSTLLRLLVLTEPCYRFI